jgi:hypothetical protein
MITYRYIAKILKGLAFATLTVAIISSCYKIFPNDSRSSVEVKPFGENKIRGICLAHSWEHGGKKGYGSESSRRTLKHLSNLGVESISITPFGWMDSVHSAEIQGEHNSSMPRSGETKDRLLDVVEQARQFDMTVVLKPHIWIRNGAWRGNLKPVEDSGSPAWDAWWSDYVEFIAYYAKIAEAAGIETLVVGVEISPALKARPDRFQSLIERLRNIYSGRLTYAANWDNTLDETYWKPLDSVGVQFYPPLSQKKSPDVTRLKERIESHLKPWTRIAAKVDKPLEILEVGYKSTPSGVAKPYGWPQDLTEKQRKVDEKLQAKAYRALFSALRDADRISSIYIWKYFTDPEDDERSGFSFSLRGKRAEHVIQKAYKR